MATKKAAAPKQAPVKEAPEIEKAEAAPKNAALGVYNGAKLVRVYSVADHGTDYKKLAEEYVSHAGGELKPYTPPAKPVSPKEDTEKVTIYHPSGDVLRVYSMKDHGKEYIELAKQFMETNKKRGYTMGSLPE
jgi:hypothetical protein